MIQAFVRDTLLLKGCRKKILEKKSYVISKNKKGTEVIDLEKNKQPLVVPDDANVGCSKPQNIEITTVKVVSAPCVEVLAPILQPILEAPGGDAVNNIIMDDDSSEDSEFVQETQVIFEKNQQLVTNAITTDSVPEIVQRDIDFLKEYWANMADLEDGNVIKQVEAPFQPVLSKSQKKAIRKKAAAASSSPYSTRAKGGNSKGAQ
jgi:hypothetical protein